MSAILEAHNLKVSYPIQRGFFGKRCGEFIAVDDVSFILERGSCLGLVGESGCGKTTCSRALLGLLPLQSGSILGDGKKINLADQQSLRAWRRNIQIVFQDPYSSLNPRLTVQFIIAEPLINYRICSREEALKRATVMMEKVGLRPELGQRYPHEFSGGQRQRIGIARALIIEPKILICDEPVSALDVSIQAQIINLLRELQKELDLAMMFISHDLAVVHHIADNIAVMHQGKIVEHGLCSQVFQDPQHDYTQTLLDAVPKI
ncbi:MAG: ABC transporter ATP-binding protein [Planctomycetes bacterium]|nr:ABC transporter ATP-binding protein [Planctomycetota bacterium]